MKRFICILLMLLVSAFMIIGNVSAGEFVVFGPEQYERTRGNPNLYTDDFQCSPGTGKLIIINGDENGKNRISAAEIEINSIPVFGEEDFSQRVYRIDVPVNLIQQNSISVKLKSKPGSFLTLQIVQEVEEVEQSSLPDTGQTKCYNNDGTEIDCPSPGENLFGQDANYDINPQSYTKLDANGKDLPDNASSWVMVRDNVTGLIWEVKNNKDDITNYLNPNDADNTYTWYDSNPETNGGDAGTPGDGTDTEDFIADLNSANFGGFSDWRMPTVKELAFIRNMDRYNPAINKDYFLTVSSVYWMSTTIPNNREWAYGVDFKQGWVFNYEKSSSLYVRAVRSGQ